MRYDIIAQQGATFTLRFYVYQSDGMTIVGDLSGYSVAGKIRQSIESSTVSKTLTGLVVTGSTALCEISLTATETAAMTARSYVYDVEVSAGAIVYRPLEGAFVLTRESTR